MTKAKATAAKSNAMKPEKIKDAVEKTNEESAAAAEAEKNAAENKAPAEGSEGSEGADPAVETAGKPTEIEKSPSPDERLADAGTKTETKDPAPAGKGKANKNAKPDAAAVEDAPAEEKKKTLADRDLTDGQDVSEMVDEILETVVSLGHPLSGALINKPKVQGVWDDVVAKARAVKNAIETQRAK